jgi:hypothetical protein
MAQDWLILLDGKLRRIGIEERRKHGSQNILTSGLYIFTVQRLPFSRERKHPRTNQGVIDLVDQSPVVLPNPCGHEPKFYPAPVDGVVLMDSMIVLRHEVACLKQKKKKKKTKQKKANWTKKKLG